MILLEYITAVYQHGNNAYQIGGHVSKNQNPALVLTQENNIIKFNFIGIGAGSIQNLAGLQPRRGHLGIYLSLDNLTEQINNFLPKPTAFAYPAVPPTNFSDPTGLERIGGAQVHMESPQYVIGGRNLRINFSKSEASPGLRINQDSFAIHLDIERTPGRVPIISISKWFRTILQLHIGITLERGRLNNTVAIPRISFEMSIDEYSQFIESLRVLINGHVMGY
nr:hypothetical protein [uncultured Mucilaginibacter sp.]